MTLRDSEENVDRAVDIMRKNQQTVLYEVLTENGQIIEGSSTHSETDPTDGTV